MAGKHHLFAVTHWLLRAATLLTLFVAIFLVLALGALLVIGTGIGGSHFGLLVNLHGVARTDAVLITGFAVSCGLICISLVFLALRATAGIVESAMSGDPFVTENAARLVRIGWLLLAVEFIGLLAHPVFDDLVGHLVPQNLRAVANLNFGDFGFGMSPAGLLAVLLIFVLAQIFRHGSEMRAELEATV